MANCLEEILQISTYFPEQGYHFCFATAMITRNVKNIRSDARLEDLVLELKDLEFDLLFVTKLGVTILKKLWNLVMAQKNPQRWRCASRSGDCCFQ